MANDIVNWFNRDNLQKQDVLLVLLLLDDSGSISGSGNTQAIIDGYNEFLKVLENAPGEVRVKTMFLNNIGNGSFLETKYIEKLTKQTYHPSGETPLFSRSVDALGYIIQEAKKLTREGKTVRTMTLIFTDGGDNHSGTTTCVDVKRIVDIMLTTDTHIIGGCAVNDYKTNFWQVFTSMGIPEHWIKVLKNDPREVKKTVTGFGSLVSTASTSQDLFSTTSRTGFRKPTNIN